MQKEYKIWFSKEEFEAEPDKPEINTLTQSDVNSMRKNGFVVRLNK